MNSIRDWMLPPQGNEYAGQVDDLYMFLVWLCLALFLLIGVLAIWFAIKYRRKGEATETPHITHHLGLEFIWSVLPLLICMGVFFWGFQGFMRFVVVPNDAKEILVTGKKWVWAFEYPDGIGVTKTLHVEVGKPVKLVMTSEDVLHSFFIPGLRIKQDVVPGRYVNLSFVPEKVGRLQVFCAEYCGKSHSDMLGEIIVESHEQYVYYMTKGIDEELKDIPLPVLGKMVYENKGCNSCHSLDGTRGQGPSFKGLFGKMEKFKDGTSQIVDENYIRQSINKPLAKVVDGFEPVMPTFQGLFRDREYLAVIQFIKEQK